MSWAVLFLIVALILFILAALNVNSPKFSLGWAGAAFATFYWVAQVLPIS